MRTITKAFASAAALLAATVLTFAFVPIASAVTFGPAAPEAASTVLVSPSNISVSVADTASMKGTVSATVDGIAKSASIAYVSGYTKATVNVPVAAALGDGVHTVTVTLTGGTAPKTYTWSFTVAEKPVFSTLVPASGVTVTNDLPDISAKVADNSGVTTCSASIDGVAAATIYDAANKLVKVTPPANLANGSRTVSVTAADAAGNAATSSWSFTVNAPVNVWSAELPTRGASLTSPATLARAEIVSTANLIGSSRIVKVDGVTVSSIFSNSTSQGTGANKGRITTNFTNGTEDGTHTVTMTIKTSSGTTATNTWQYRVGVPPVIGLPTPAAGALSTTTPQITVPLTDNSAVALWNVTVNGAPVPATLSGGVLSIALPAPLEDDAVSTIVVTAFDDSGLSATRSWTYAVQTHRDMVSQVSQCASCHPTEAAGTPTHNNGPACNECHIDNGGDPHPGAPASYHTPASTSGCRPCHSSSITVEHQRWADKNGNQITCMTCHNSTNPTVTAAIAAGDSNCSTCHVTTEHATVHESALAAECSACHQPNLVTEHVTTHSLSCATCHESSDPNVVAAIAGGNLNCSACHLTGSASHYTSVDHTATPAPQSILISGVDYGSHACNECHSLRLGDLHKDVNGDPACTTCHPTPRSTFTTWGFGCVQGGCHTVTSSAPMHASIDTSHSAPTNACTAAGCHAGKNLAALHADATTVTAGVTRTSCQMCHYTGVTPTSDCATSGCHDPANPHAALADKHTATDAPTTTCASPGCHSTTNAITLHAGAAAGACAVCHNNPTHGNMTTGKTTTACAGCHTTSGVDYHTGLGTSHAAPVNGCTAYGCHAGKDLPTLHADATTVTAGVTRTSCQMCHYTGVTPTSDCTACHNAASPHKYDATAHTATMTSATVTILGTSLGTHACSECHASTDIRGYHANDCTKCHPTAITGSWNKHCDAAGCHAPGTSKPMHGTIDASHTVSSGLACTAAGCHGGVGNAAAIHSNATTTVAGTLRTSCQVCHAAGLTPTTNCASCHDLAAPHAGVAAAHSSPGANAFVSVGMTDGDHSGWAGIAADCSQCHKTELTALHKQNCAACHGSTNPTVIAAMQAGKNNCTACHTNPHNTTITAHNNLYDSGTCTCHDGNWDDPGSGCATCHTP